MDIKIPEMEGLKAASKICKRPNGPGQLLIMALKVDAMETRCRIHPGAEVDDHFG